MEYVQMTIGEWIRMKQKLKQELQGVKQSFVRIGYALRKIEDGRLYEQDGYKSIAEFAKTEYGLEPSTTSRFMAINREYSVDGYSETLRPEFADLGRSQLEEMLKLPESDRQMIQPETSREDIRDLKRFNKSAPAAGVADDIRQLAEKFYRDNPEILNAVFGEPAQEDGQANIKRLAEIINPAGNRSYKKGIYFMMMYENRITIKKFGSTPQDMTWEEFIQLTTDIFGESAAGAKTWSNYFGEEPAGKPDQDHPAEASAQKKPADKLKISAEEKSVKGKQEEKEDAGDRGAADENRGADGETEKGNAEDGNDGKEGIESGHQKPAEKTDEYTAEKSRRNEIAPAQSPETLEGEASDEAGNGEGFEPEESGSAAPEKAAVEGAETAAVKEPEEAAVEAVEMAAEEPWTAAVEETVPDIVGKRYGTRKEYINTLTAREMAEYIANACCRCRTLNMSYLLRPAKLEEWLLQEVDENGREVKKNDS